MDRLLDFLYRRFQNDKAPPHFSGLLRDYIESGLAPPHLEQEILTGDDGKLWSYLWEAMLFRHLSSLGYEFVRGQVTKKGQVGPDFGLAIGSTIVWIEANAPLPVDIPDDWLKSPKIGEFLLREKPSDRMLLRWTLAVERKTEIFERYLNQGTVGPDDCLVIAINSCQLADFDPDDCGSSQLPFAVEAVFPIGPLGISLKPDGRPAEEARRVSRFSIRDHRQSEVSTSKFLDPAFAAISAVIGCNNRHMLDGALRMVLVHNPLAKNRLPLGTLGKCTEYFAEKEGDHYVLQNQS